MGFIQLQSDSSLIGFIFTWLELEKLCEEKKEPNRLDPHGNGSAKSSRGDSKPYNIVESSILPNNYRYWNLDHNGFHILVHDSKCWRKI